MRQDSGKSKHAKRGLFAVAAAAALFFMFGCARDTDGIVRIEERMFAAHFSHIYMNAIDYLGRTIQLEGVFLKKWWGWPYYAPFRYFVMRFVPGHCCGGFIGFEVKWPEERPFPEDGSWVEATGTLGADSALNLYLKLSSLTVLERRGAEMVTQQQGVIREAPTLWFAGCVQAAALRLFGLSKTGRSKYTLRVKAEDI